MKSSEDMELNWNDYSRRLFSLWKGNSGCLSEHLSDISFGKARVVGRKYCREVLGSW